MKTFRPTSMSTSVFTFALAWFWLGLIASTESAFAATVPRMQWRVLFLGDTGHHQPAERFKQLQPVLARHGIELVYTERLDDLNPGQLAGFDALAIFANHVRIAPEQENALVDFVAGGGGLVPIHCASYCFLNSPRYIELVGAQFKSHGTGVFRETVLQPNHPIFQGCAPIESWDETYVHTKHNPDREVLAERRDEQGAEPYTWVRQHGQGRVFYTAWGHDQRTWGNTNFQALIENGIRWAAARSPNRLVARSGLKPFEYKPAPSPMPNYLPDQRWGTEGDPITTMQQPLAPQESRPHLVTLPGFSVSLFAAEPEITKPIWLAWDERGRLWIAETVDYPNDLKREGQGRDRIKICTDTDGDGRADKFTVFADHLSIPTSFCFARGGIIVAQAPELLFLKDTDGDDHADVREVLMTGWGTADTHAEPSNLHYGFDGWIWGVVGYSGFNGTVGGKKLRFGQGFFRFKPDGSVLEFVRSSNNNTWGLGLSEEGYIFGSTANNNASMFMPIPNRYYEAVQGWSAAALGTIADGQQFYPVTDKIRQVDAHGRYTAGAGSALYTARNFPTSYWNSVQFVAEPTGHLLGKFHLQSRGADFAAHNGRSFLASDDEWTAPIAAEVGPDGALWVIDWYNYIIQHNPTPHGFKTGRGNAYDTPLRDKQHGRIYHVSWNQAKPAAALNLSQATARDLVRALQNDNLLWRLHAQRLLIERGSAQPNQINQIEEDLVRLIRERTVDTLGLNPPALHALWTLHGLGRLQSPDGSPRARLAAAEALGHPSPSVRRTALMVLRDPGALALILHGKLLDDPDPQVRLAALLAVADLSPISGSPSVKTSSDTSDATSKPAVELEAELGGNLYAMLQKTENAADHWIPQAATAAAARHDDAFLRSVLARATIGASVKESPRGNVLTNASFENEQDGRPQSWTTVTHSGRGEFSLANTGHTGARSVRISSTSGADVSWSQRIAAQPRCDYRLTGWVKTENLTAIRGGRGAQFNIHEIQGDKNARSRALTGSQDWTELEILFNSGEYTALTVNCLFGGWGHATGTAWFDDVELVPVSAPALPGEVGQVLQVVTAHYAARAPVETIVPTLTALAGASPAVAGAILDGLIAGWPADIAPRLDEPAAQTVAGWMQTLPAPVRDRLALLAQRWGRSELFAAALPAITADLRRQIGDTTATDLQRIGAARRLVTLEDRPQSLEVVLQSMNPLMPPALAAGLVNAANESRHPQAPTTLLAAWNKFSPAARRAVITALLRRPESIVTLLDAIEHGTISRTDLAAEHWSQLKRHPDKTLADRATALSNAAGSISADREAVVKKLLPLAAQKGDRDRGRAVFTAQCANCHTFNGTGGKIGPELTGIGARPRADLLIEILDPNRSVEANYRLWNVSTKDGETYSGRLEAETQGALEILDTAGQKHVIQRSQITSLDASQLSIMPVGFETLPEPDLLGLLEYLANP